MTPALLLIKAAAEPHAPRNGNASKVLHSIAERLHLRVEKRAIDGVDVVARPHSKQRSGVFSEVFNLDAGAAKFFVSVREDEVSVNLYDIRAGEVAEVYDGPMNPAAVLKWAMHAAAAYSITAAYAAAEAPSQKNAELLKRFKLDTEKLTPVPGQRGVYDYEGDVPWYSLNLKKLPIRFRKVSGNFYCDDNQLTSLQGGPEEVGGDFICNRNLLASLQGAPEKVCGDFICSNNNITSLLGGPEHVGGNYRCDGNFITSLEGAPAYLGGHFECRINRLPHDVKIPASISHSFHRGLHMNDRILPAQAAAEAPLQKSWSDILIGIDRYLHSRPRRELRIPGCTAYAFPYASDRPGGFDFAIFRVGVPGNETYYVQHHTGKLTGEALELICGSRTKRVSAYKGATDPKKVLVWALKAVEKEEKKYGYVAKAAAEPPANEATKSIVHIAKFLHAQRDHRLEFDDLGVIAISMGEGFEAFKLLDAEGTDYATVQRLPGNVPTVGIIFRSRRASEYTGDMSPKKLLKYAVTEFSKVLSKHKADQGNPLYSLQGFVESLRKHSRYGGHNTYSFTVNGTRIYVGTPESTFQDGSLVLGTGRESGSRPELHFQYRRAPGEDAAGIDVLFCPLRKGKFLKHLPRHFGSGSTNMKQVLVELLKEEVRGKTLFQYLQEE